MEQSAIRPAWQQPVIEHVRATADNLSFQTVMENTVNIWCYCGVSAILKRRSPMYWLN